MLAQPGIKSLSEEADALVPIPLSSEGLRHRGYNQATLLAQAICSSKTKDHWLIRAVQSSAQHTLKRTQRLQALKGAFALHAEAMNQINNKRVVLVDDVMTTGATIFSAAQTLLAGGAKAVSAVVFARTEENHGA